MKNYFEMLDKTIKEYFKILSDETPDFLNEYINTKERFGYWKDTGIMLKGEGVWNLTTMFLHMWNSFRPTDEDYDKFRPHVHLINLYNMMDIFSHMVIHH